MLDQARVKELLHYNPETGAFTWKQYRAGLAKVGNSAGSYDNRGYLRIKIDDQTYKAHALAFVYLYGYRPKIIDHINGVKDDNRACNLRDVTDQQNSLNRSLGSRNKSGVKGVWLDKASGKWKARVVHDGRQHSGGSHASKDDAIASANNLRHALHGEYARIK